MAQITLDLSGIKGLGLRFYGDKNLTASQPNLRYLGTDGQLAEGVFNPITTLGYLSPANDTVKAITGTTSFLLTSSLVSTIQLLGTTTNSIFFADEAVTGTAGQVVNLDTAIDTSLDATYTVPTVGGTEYMKITDMIMYTVNGVMKIFWTKQNTTTYNTTNDLGIATVAFESPNATYGSVTITGTGGTADYNAESGRAFFCLADNGFLYLLKGARVHKIDGSSIGGTNGTITQNVLKFIGSNTGSSSISILKDAIDLRGKMWIGLHVIQGTLIPGSGISLNNKSINNFVGIYIWDRKSTSASMQDFIEITGAKELKSLHKFQGQASCFTISVDGYTQFRVWNGSEFKVVQTMGTNAYPVYRRHSVQENGDNIMWLGNDGKIYCYGKIEAGLDNALYIIGDMSSHVSDGETYSGSGVFIPANATETVTTGNQASPLAFYISFKDTGGNHLVKWYPYSTDTVATNAQVAHIGNVYTLVKYLPDMSNIQYVDIRCAPCTTSDDTIIATIKYYFNGKSTASITKTITNTEASRGYIRHELNKPYCNTIQMEIEYATGNTMGSDYDFRPSVAIVTYEPTATAR